VTPARVADASAIAAVVFGEPEGALALERIGNAPLLAPTLLRYELASVSWKAARRGANPEACREALRLALSLDIEFREVDHPAVLDLALATRLTVYDASYLWLARSLGIELVTLDTRLAAAAKTRGGRATR
jgi:predicted nucleic acid-binding protein